MGKHKKSKKAKLSNDAPIGLRDNIFIKRVLTPQRIKEILERFVEVDKIDDKTTEGQIVMKGSNPEGNEITLRIDMHWTENPYIRIESTSIETNKTCQDLAKEFVKLLPKMDHPIQLTLVV